jgi:ABC-type glycerol-3-phosphate transport system permease component
MKARPLEFVLRIALYAIIVVGAVVFAMPFVWMIRTALMPPWQVYTFPPEWIPEEMYWENWIRPWNMLPFHIFFRNTIYVVALKVLGTIFSSAVAAYGFARLRFPGRDFLFILVLSVMMLPQQVTLIPQYLIYSRLGWINSFKPIWVGVWLGASSFNLFLMRQFFMTIPKEMDDAARIDGCGIFSTFWRIMVPLSLPALGVISIFEFTYSWNEFLVPLIYLNEERLFTLAIGLRRFQTTLTLEMEALMAATVTTLLPVLLVFFFAQRYFVQGIVITGVKG